MDLDHVDAKLFAGLAKVQQKLEQPSKDSIVDTGKYKYKFATLNEVIASVQMAEAETGISFSQNVNSNEDGSQSVTTMIFHEGGGFIIFDPVTINAAKKAQDTGSAISYARRYSLQTAFGIAAEEDDDGQIANNNYQQPQNNQQRRQQANQAASDDQKEIERMRKNYEYQVKRTLTLIDEVSKMSKTSPANVQLEAFKQANIDPDKVQQWKTQGLALKEFQLIQASLIQIRNMWNRENIQKADAK